MHLHVDVHGATGVPPRIDRAEEHKSLRVRPLDPAHEAPVAGALAEAGIDAACVRVPDVDCGAPDRLARRRVHDEGAQKESCPRPAFRDVPPHCLVWDVVRPLGLLRGQHARDGPRGDRRGAGTLRALALDPTDADRACDQPAKPQQRPAAGDLAFIHGRQLSRPT